MAGYRPKSLDELNEMYDKTITAEKAIIKATKQLHDATETIVPSELHTEKPEAIKEDTAEVEEFSSEVDSLINRFKEEIKAPQIKEVVKTEIPEMEEPVFPTVPENISFEKETEPIPEPAEPILPAKEIAAAAPVMQSRPKVHYSLETPDELQQKANARSEERTDLFNDYMKIMNDEDDDFFSKRDSFKKKDKKKKHKKGLFFRHEPKAEEFEEEEALTEDETEEKASSDSSDALPLNEVVYTPEVPEANGDFKVEFYAENDEENEDEAFSSFDEVSTDETDEDFSEEETEADEETDYEDFASDSVFDILPDESDELSQAPEEIEDNSFDEYVNSSEDIYSYDPSKKNTIPEYDQEQYTDEDDVQEEGFYKEDETAEPPKNKKGIIAGRVLLSIVLAILAVLATGIIGINTLLGVDTGKTAFDEKFIFTASQNYTNSNILEGDLVVTEKRYANDGEVFAYINYTQQCFMFGKRNGSIVNDSGDVLFIAENDGERVLVLRDDTRGVVTATYPGIGKIVSVCTDYFIPIIAAVLLLGLIIVLLLAFVFKDKEKAYEKMMKKMIKKGVISADEEAEYDFSEDSEEEDLFSTIE